MSPSDKYKKPDSDAAVDISRAIRLLSLFKDLSGNAPISYAMCFLEVSRTPGSTVSAIAERTGMQRPVASRILLELGERTRTGEEGLGLVERSHGSEDLREVHYHLTDRGKRLLKQMRGVVSGTAP